jgi:hypothetical protein
MVYWSSGTTAACTMGYHRAGPAQRPIRLTLYQTSPIDRRSPNMVAFAQLHAQNHKITELSNVFLYLVRDRSMCDTDVTCDVFFDLTNRVKEHMELVDREICSQLISHPDQRVKNTANRFLSGSTEIKRIFNAYVKQWCSQKCRSLTIDDHPSFLQDTEQMFALVMDRIQRETEHLYPLIRKLEGEDKQVA